MAVAPLRATLSRDSRVQAVVEKWDGRTGTTQQPPWPPLLKQQQQTRVRRASRMPYRHGKMWYGALSYWERRTLTVHWRKRVVIRMLLCNPDASLDAILHTLEPFLHPQCFPASLARTCEQHTLLCLQHLQHLDRWLQRAWPCFTVSQCLPSETATRLTLFYCLATPKLLTTTRLALCHRLATPRLRAAARLAPFHYLATPRPRAIKRWPYITVSQCLDRGLQRAWPCFTVSLHGQIGHILR